MALIQPTKDLLAFLQKNPAIRSRIAAPPNATLLYAGNFFRPIWQELEQLKRTNRDLASKRLLNEVLAGINTPGQPHATLLAWVKSFDSLNAEKDCHIVWRALSGIYASNAIGAVSFYVGSGLTKPGTVFLATELPVLMRNPKIDAQTKEMLQYYQRCAQAGKGGQIAINVGFITGQV